MEFVLVVYILIFAANFFIKFLSGTRDFLDVMAESLMWPMLLLPFFVKVSKKVIEDCKANE